MTDAEQVQKLKAYIEELRLFCRKCGEDMKPDELYSEEYCRGYSNAMFTIEGLIEYEDMGT